MPVKIVSNRAVQRRPEKLERTYGIREYWEKKDTILVLRSVGGLGDILMHRMIFEDIKLLVPDVKIHFACPKVYHDVVADHPYIDKVLPSETVNHRDYYKHYNTSSICGRVEMQLAPKIAPHRSDIWAERCGLTLKNHNMHIHLTDDELQTARKVLEANRTRSGPMVALCPFSAMQLKNLLPHQIVGVTTELHKRGYCVVGLHRDPILELEEIGVPTIVPLGERNLRLWMSIIHEIDYVVTVDTAAFHCAGGMGKPAVGIFTFVSGEAYGQYYPSIEIVQGPCPLAHIGCYNISLCPKRGIPKPCLEGITVKGITEAFSRMAQRFPAQG